jgi:CelD/BcsL family acetyltransferase involved in cellulose biosynthesis
METQSIRSATQFEIVSDIDAFTALHQEWEALWRSAKGTPFQLFRYCLHALREVAIPTGASLHCIIGRQDGRMVLAWPLIRYREYAWTTVRPLAPDISEQSEVLVDHSGERESLVAAAWRVLLSSCGSDIIRLPMVRTGSALHRHASAAKWQSRGEPRIIGMARLMRYGKWTEYRQTLPDSFRKEQDYHQRRLLRAGESAMLILGLDDPRSAAYVETMLEWKHQWAAKVGAGGEFFEQPYQNFLRNMSADSLFGQSFRLFISTLNGKAIAISLVAITERTVIGMQAAYDPAQSKCSPGSLLLESILKWAFENQRDVDFGSGDSRYKSIWTGGLGYACTDFRIAVSRWGQMAFAARALQVQYGGLRQRIAGGSLGRQWKARLGKKAEQADQPLGTSTHGT